MARKVRKYGIYWSGLLAGIYNQVTIPRALILEGEDKDTTIIQGSGYDYGIYSNSVSGNTIKNLKIQGFYAGIYMYYSGGSKLTDNIVTANLYGIYLHYSDSSKVSKNTVSVLHSSAYGIFLRYSSDSTLIENTVSGRYYGIFLHHSDSNKLTGNLVLGSYYGIHVFYSGDNTFKDNTITGSKYNFGVYGGSLLDYDQDIDTSNKVDGTPIYYWVGHSDETVPLDAGYVGIVNSHHITVQALTQHLDQVADIYFESFLLHGLAFH